MTPGVARPQRKWWRDLALLLSLIAVVLNVVALFLLAANASVPAHYIQPLPNVEEAQRLALPYWGLLILMLVAAAASITVRLRGHSRTAMWLGAVQLLPLGILAVLVAASAVLYEIS